MKREPRDETISRMRSIWPILFWRWCPVCEKDFRREWGWSYTTIHECNTGIEHTVCAQCCPTKQAFVEFLKRPIRMPRGGTGTEQKPQGPENVIRYLNGREIRPKPPMPPVTTITKEGEEHKRYTR